MLFCYFYFLIISKYTLLYFIELNVSLFTIFLKQFFPIQANMSNIQHLLDFRIIDFEIDKLISSNQSDNFDCILVLELSDLEPITFNFKNLPFNSSSNGMMCIIPNEEMIDFTSGPIYVSIFVPFIGEGYKCIARSKLDYINKLEDSHFLNVFIDKPSISVRTAKVIKQGLLNFDLVNGTGVSTKNGNLTIFLRLIQLREPKERFIEHLSALHLNNPLNSVDSKSSYDDSVLLGSVSPNNEYNDLSNSIIDIKESLKSIKSKINKRLDGPVRHIIETDLQNKHNKEIDLLKTSIDTFRSSIDTSNMILNGPRWRNPNDINIKSSINSSFYLDNQPDKSNFKVKNFNIEKNKNQITYMDEKFSKKDHENDVNKNKVKIGNNLKETETTSEKYKIGKIDKNKITNPKTKNKLKSKDRYVGLGNYKPSKETVFDKALSSLNKNRIKGVNILLKSNEAAELGIDYISNYDINNQSTK